MNQKLKTDQNIAEPASPPDLDATKIIKVIGYESQSPPQSAIPMHRLVGYAILSDVAANQPLERKD